MLFCWLYILREEYHFTIAVLLRITISIEISMVSFFHSFCVSFVSSEWLMFLRRLNKKAGTRKRLKMQQLADKEIIEAARQQKRLIRKAKGQKERLAKKEEGIKKANM